MDVGKDVKRKRESAVAKKMAAAIPELLQKWTMDNYPYFEQTMEMIREGAPVQWVKLYMEAVKLGIEKNTNINININRQKDRDDLQALVRTKITAIPDSGTYTPFEEVRPQPLPIRREEEDI